MTPNIDSPHADLLARHRRVLPDWLTLFYDEPIELVSGSGRRVTDGEGRSYLDFFGGILTTMTGHAVPEVVDAIRTQAGRMLHSSTLYLVRPDGRASRADLGPVGHPRRQGVLRQLRAARPTTPPCSCAARRGGPIRSWPCATAITADPLPAWRPPGCGPGRRRASPRSTSATCTAGYRYRSPFGHLPDAEYIAACVEDLRGRDPPRPPPATWPA